MGVRTGGGIVRRAVVGGVAAAATLGLAACDGQQEGSAPATVTQTVTQSPTAPQTTTAPDPSTSTTTTTSASPSATPSDWAGVVEQTGDSVVRLDVASCDGRWMGSGFVVAPDLVMTAAHVVDGAVAMSLQTSAGVVTGQVVDLDTTTDSALVRTNARLEVEPLPMAAADVGLGSSIAILGFPLEAYSLRVSQGLVSGLDERVDYGGVTVEHAMVTDAAINGGNSGGPVVDRSGNVVGLVTGKRMWVTGGDPAAGAAEGIGYVIPVTALKSNLAAWRDEPSRDPADCGADGEAPVADDGILAVDVHSSEPAAVDIARSLSLHGQGINQGNYEAAWEIFSPRMKSALKDVETWKDGLGTSYWERLSVISVEVSADSATVQAGLQTRQDAEFGHQGQTCSLWNLTYRMVNAQGGWLIDKVTNAPGSPKAC